MKLYRVMKVDPTDGKPLVGTRRNMLGVRPTDPANTDPRRRFDVAAVTDADPVDPREGLSTEVVPDNLTVGPREALFGIESDDLPAELGVKPDRPPHHLIGPAARMTLGDYQAALESTRDLWDRVQ